MTPPPPRVCIARNFRGLVFQADKGKQRRSKGPFELLFIGHPMACEYLGPQLFEFFVDIGEMVSGRDAWLAGWLARGLVGRVAAGWPQRRDPVCIIREPLSCQRFYIV